MSLKEAALRVLLTAHANSQVQPLRQAGRVLIGKEPALTCVVFPLPVSPDTTTASAVASVSASCCRSPAMGSRARCACIAAPSAHSRLRKMHDMPEAAAQVEMVVCSCGWHMGCAYGTSSVGINTWGMPNTMHPVGFKKTAKA